jgi:cell wall assembly regulator SMI1
MTNNIKDAIQAFETKARLSFPDELKNYYLKSNGQLFSNYHFVRKVDDDFEQGGFLDEIMPLSELIRVYFSMQDDESYVNALSNAQLIPFGESNGGALICMASSNDPALHGKIYVFDWDFDATFQADSLEEFLGQLRVFEEIE